MPLKAKHELFVSAFLNTANATKAAIAAGYAEHTAGVTGCKLLKHPEIAAAVAAAQAARSEKLARTAEDVMRDLAMVILEASKDRNWMAVNKALELQGKHLGMFTDRLHVTMSEAEREERIEDLFATALSRMQGRAAHAGN